MRFWLVHVYKDKITQEKMFRPKKEIRTLEGNDLNQGGIVGCFICLPRKYVISAGN